jgi:hypothetical protein
MNKLDNKRRTQIVSALVEGCSIRATSRMVGVSKDTVMKLLVDIGTVCANYQDEAFRNLNCKRLQADEIWSFCHAKAKKVLEEKRGVLAMVTCGRGRRLMQIRNLFLAGILENVTLEPPTSSLPIWRAAWPHRVQLATDGHKPYLEAVEGAFGCEIDLCDAS